MNRSSSSSINKVHILDFVNDEVTLNARNLHDFLKSNISDGGQELPVAFIGLLGSNQREKSLAANLVLNYLAISGVGPNTRLKRALGQATQLNPSGMEQEGVSIWEQPFLIETKENKLVKIWILEFATSPNAYRKYQQPNLPLIAFAKMVCSRLVEVVDDENARILSPATLFDQDTMLSYPSFSLGYILQTPGGKQPKSFKDDHKKFNKFKNSSPVEVLGMGKIDGRTATSLRNIEDCINLIVDENEISYKSGWTVSRIEGKLTSHCAEINQMFRKPSTPPSPEPIRRKGSGFFGSWGKNKNRSFTKPPKEKRTDPPYQHLSTGTSSSSTGFRRTPIPPAFTQQDSEGFYKLLEGPVVKYFNQTMSSRFTEKQEYFSAGQMKKIYGLLCTRIFNVIGGQISSSYLRKLEHQLETQLEQHKQTNMRFLRGKVKQAESIIHTLKTKYNNKLESQANPNSSRNPETELAQKLKLEMWANIGPGEPIENHLKCLLSQVKSAQSPSSHSEQVQVYLAIQLNHKTVTMGIWKDGQCLQLENEHRALEIPTVVGLTKVHKLVYGSQVSRAEKNGTILRKFQIGEHFKGKDDSQFGGKYELPLKSKVYQVGIEFFLGYIFKKLKTSAERQTQTEMSGCVITVPCHFSSYQRLEVKYAGIAAGFHDVRVISDTSAAAIEYAFFSEESQNSAFTNFRVLCESNQKLYGGTCIFDKDGSQLSITFGEKHFSPQGRNKTEGGRKATALYNYVTKHYHAKLKDAKGERPNQLVLILYEHSKWGGALTSICKVNESVPMEGRILQGAIHKFQNFKGQILEIFPYQIQISTERGSFTSNVEEQDFSFEVHSQETNFSQQIVDKNLHPIGTLCLTQFFPGVMKHTISFSRNEEGHINLERLIEATKRSVKDLENGRDFTWSTGENSLRNEVPENTLLINRLFSRSIEEVKWREGQAHKVKSNEKRKEVEEIFRRKQELGKMCKEMREMIENNQVQLPGIIQTLVVDVIMNSEQFAHQTSPSLEAVKAQIQSLNRYYEKYFMV